MTGWLLLETVSSRVRELRGSRGILCQWSSSSWEWYVQCCTYTSVVKRLIKDPIHNNSLYGHVLLYYLPIFFFLFSPLPTEKGWSERSQHAFNIFQHLLADWERVWFSQWYVCAAECEGVTLRCPTCPQVMCYCGESAVGSSTSQHVSTWLYRRLTENGR